MSEFHNPYHFVPVKKRTAVEKQQDVSVTSARDGNWGTHSHESYCKGLHSGRLTCRLTTETPIFIGGKQVDGTGPKQVDPFMLNNEPAIPASSLRGLLSSIAESASNSALRVLHREQILSYRKPLGNYLSALGMIIKEGNKLKLRPLVLPNLKGDNKNGYTLGPGYREIFSSTKYKNVPLKAYLNHYRYDRSTKQFSKSGFLKSNPDSFNINRPEYFYMNLSEQSDYCVENGVLAFSNNLKTKQGKKSEHEFCLGQKPLSDSVSKTPKDGYVRGIIYVLGIDVRKNMINTKKHEIFIPYPEWINDVPLLEIPDNVINTFENLADERLSDSIDKDGKRKKEEDLYPYSPVGSERNSDPKELEFKLRLKHGDIVYFAPNENGTEVTEISFSSIWRGSAGRVEDYFMQIDEDLLPFNLGRTSITPAELLFGFVQDGKEGHKDNGDVSGSLAFKGKVRISNATLEKGQNEPFMKEEVTLKILSSPKPPSPALYFKKANNSQGGYIAKAELKPDKHHPQGRKMYLHHQINDNQVPWKSGNPGDLKQKNQIKPLREKLEFTFSVDFDNLTDWELGLLCYAIRPAEEFRHKIGMGKPIGLGSVRIELEKLEVVQRNKRYSVEGFTSGRYEPADAENYRSIFAKGMDKQIANALQVLGDPGKIKHPVHTPRVQGGDSEKDSFKWFVANDVGSGSKNHGNSIAPAKIALAPITGDTIPSLPYLPIADGSSRPQPPSMKGGEGRGSGHKPDQGGRQQGRDHHQKKPNGGDGKTFTNNAFASLNKDWKK